MGIDFDIIDDKGKMIDRYAIKWLYRYDIEIFYYANDIKNMIQYCNENIEILKLRVDKHEKIKKIEYLEFYKKKEYLCNLINNTNTDEEINELIENIYNREDKDHDHFLLDSFIRFKEFLEKYIDYNCEISC